MNIYKKLLGNSVIFAIGNLGSKLISIILVPLYTYYLTTIEYGTVDIITTTCSLLLPIISLSIYDAVLRFVMDKDQNKNTIITNALMITIIGAFIILLLYPLLSFFNALSDLLIYMIIILILQSFQSLFSQFTRAVGKIKYYALNGIIMTMSTAGMNILLLVYYNLGIKGYLLSLIVSNLVSICFLIFSTKIYKYIKFNKINKKTIKKMLVYCIPLIPNALMWWLMNASSRYFILFFVGASANGLFAVANKIPALLTILSTVFFQAWQLSAIEQYDSKDKSKFYSEVFNYFSMVMFLGASAIILVLKMIIDFLVAPEFYSSWELVPFLLIGVIFSSFSSFLGTNYIAAKQTNGVFRTSVIGGIVSIISNLIFIPMFGTNGAGLSTMFSFFIIWTLRVYDTKKFISMKINIRNISTNLLLLAFQIFVLYIKMNSILEFVLELILFSLSLLVNRNLLRPIKKIYMLKKKKDNH